MNPQSFRSAATRNSKLVYQTNVANISTTNTFIIAIARVSLQSSNLVQFSAIPLDNTVGRDDIIADEKIT